MCNKPVSLKIIRILQHGLQWYFLNIQKGACIFCFDKSIAIVTQLYNRNLSISNFKGNLTSQSFIIKANDILFYDNFMVEFVCVQFKT